MKKIVGILAATAMAASMFAADISSMIQYDGDLMSFDGTNFKMFEENGYDPSGDSDYIWKLSVNGDKAGAEIWSWSVGGTATNWGEIELTDTADWVTKYKFAGMLPGGASVISQAGLWFKPVDALKLTVGHVGGKSIVNPQFGWWAQTANMWGNGYQADVTLDAVSITVALAPGDGNYFIDGSKKGFDILGNFWADVKYNANFGSLQAFAAKGATVGAHGYSNWAASDLTLGAAYANLPYLQTGYGADVAATFKKDGDNLKFQGIDSQVVGQYSFNGTLLQLTNLIQYRDAFKYGFEFRARTAIEAFTPYINIDGYDVMNKKLIVNLGCGTSVGACTIDASFKTPIDMANYSFSFSVPVQFTVNF